MFHKREQGLGDSDGAPDEFLDAGNALRYQHVIAGQDADIAANLNHIARRALGDDR